MTTSTESRKNRPSRFLQEREFLGLVLASANHDATQSVAVAIQKLGCGMHHHVGAKRDRLLKKTEQLMKLGATVGGEQAGTLSAGVAIGLLLNRR